MTHLSRMRWLAALSPVLALAPMQRAIGQSGQTGKGVPHARTGQMDPDHHFLRDLADHNEAMVYLAHSAMQMKHAHAGGADAAGAVDVVADARKRELVSLLRTRFNDTRDPTPPPALRQQVDSLMKLEGERFEAAVKDFSRRHHQAAIEMIDHAKLRRREIKVLAKRIRAQYVKEMGASSEPVHRLLPIVRIDEGEVVPSFGYPGRS